MPSRRILVTNALIYANGPLHLGHMVDVIQSDIWVRFQRMLGHECYYVGGDDAHGTPVMLRAREEGIEPETLVERMYTSHVRDLKAFHVEFDNYYTTHSEENRALCNAIYAALRDGGHVARRTVRQAYDEQAGMFLPDRYIKGTCPNCGTPDQYGDACENCGATYSPAELINPVSVVSGTRPVERESEHFFFKLGDFEKLLAEWTRGRDEGNEHQHVDAAVLNKLGEWFEAGLRDWDISRDAPYFGFEIPDAPGKYFYVWLDAPIGYMASFRDYCSRNPEIDFDSFWDAGKAKREGTELYHFIGKDITYFHTLFWPAMLTGSGHRMPTGVFVHGFLTVNGTKMSKSRGTFINAGTWLDHLDAEPLRYYFAAKLGPGVDDIDLNPEDFVQRVNSDLVGKYVNIASRIAGFLHKDFDGRLAEKLPDVISFETDDSRTQYGVLHDLSGFSESGTFIQEAYEARDFGQVVRRVMSLADLANHYINGEMPWKLAKASRKAELWGVCTLALNFFRILTIYLKPILPALAQEAEDFLNIPPLTWADADKPLLDHVIKPYKPLATRIDPKAVAAMLEASRESLAKT